MGAFQTTRWSLILASRDVTREGAAALDQLCRIYRSPVLAYVRHRGYAGDQAEDLTQSYFAHLLDRGIVHRADPARGPFRAFLLGSIRNFLANMRDAERAQKRGGGAAAVEIDESTALAPEGDTPEAAFDREFALTLLRRAMQALEREAREAGRLDQFRALKPFIVEAPDADDYAKVAERLGQRRNTVAVAIHRLRERLRQLVRVELAETVASPEDVQSELEVLSRGFGGAV